MNNTDTIGQVATAVNAIPLILAVLGFVFALIQALSKYYIDKRIHNQQMRELLEKALTNGLGVVQQVASGVAYKESSKLTGIIPPNLAPGVQYVMDHACEALQHFKLSPEEIMEKLIARAGVREIDTNIAATASSATPAVVPPLAPSTPVTAGEPASREEIHVAAACPPTTPGVILPDAPAVITHPV